MQKENWNRSQRLDKIPKMSGKVQKEKKHRIEEKSGKEPGRKNGRGKSTNSETQTTVINYVIPDSEDEDLEENSEVIQLRPLMNLCRPKVGRGCGGETT